MKSEAVRRIRSHLIHDAVKEYRRIEKFDAFINDLRKDGAPDNILEEFRTERRVIFERICSLCDDVKDFDKAFM